MTQRVGIVPGTPQGDQDWDYVYSAIKEIELWSYRAQDTDEASGSIFDTVAVLEAATVGADTDVVETLGYYEAGDGGGAKYHRVDEEPAHSFWVQSSDGAYWVAMPDQSGAISILVNGAVADGDQGDSSVGTDNWQFIQDLIDAHTYYKVCSYVSFPPGAFRITKCIQCGYGIGKFDGPFIGQFQDTHVRGSGGAMVLGDSTLVCDFSDQPAVIIQGQRSFVWYGVSLLGQYAAYVDEHKLGLNDYGDGGADVDDSDEDNWIDSSLASNAHSETAPYAGFACDPWSCDDNPPSSGDFYPSDMAIPEFLWDNDPHEKPDMYQSGFSGNRTFSSQMEISECAIYGFDTCFASHPAGTAGSDGNGDFLHFNRVQFSHARYGISIAHTQCRQVNRTNCDFGQMYCAETTSKHGVQNGRLGGVNINCSFDSIINIHLIFNDLSVAGPIVYVNAYGENIWRLGFAGNSTAVATSIHYIGCNFSFGSQCPNDDDEFPLRGVPDGMLSGTSASQMSILFEGGSFGDLWSVFMLACGTDRTGGGIYGFGRTNNLTINGTSFSCRGAFGDAIRTTTWERAASSVLGGGLAIQNVPELKAGMIRLGAAAVYDLSDAEGEDLPQRLIIGPTSYSSREYPVCAYAKYAVPREAADNCEAVIPPMYYFMDKGASTTGALDLTTLIYTFTFNSPQSDYDAIRWGPQKGDVLIDVNTNSVFFVSDRTGDDVTAVLQNNFKPDPLNPGDFLQHDDFDPADGYLYVINARIYTPEAPLIGDMVVADSTVINMGMPNGDDSRMEDDIVEGDWYCVDQYSDEWPFADDAEVLTLAAGSIDFSGDARYDESRHRFKFFIRPSSD